MRRGLAWAAGLAGVLTAFLVRRRRAAAPAAADPADELRRKLAQARATQEPAAAPEPAPAVTPPNADERRREVHEQARAAIEEMRPHDEQ